MEAILNVGILFYLVFGPTVAAGLWTEWEGWSTCSRSCGIGVTLSRRHCLHSVNNCSGVKIRYRTCNTQDCPSGSTDFKTEQCANAIGQLSGILPAAKWVAATGPHLNPCALHCKAQGTWTVKQFGHKVLDGTRCDEDSLDICVNGQCQNVGCDRQLNSGKKTDVCGICDGDGKSCRLVTGLYRSDPEKNKESEVIITVPRNSRHISVSARGLGHVGLKLHESATIDLIASNTSILATRNYVGRSNMVVNYKKFSTSKEYFDVPGPVPGDIEVLAFYDDVVWKYIRYEFYQPLTAMWVHDEETVVCTKTCGNGLRYIWPMCVDVKTLERRSKKECEANGLVPPSPKVYRCNTNPCPGSWQPDPWTDCSASCNGGFQTRTISCTEDDSEGRSFISVNDSPCLGASLTPLPSRRKCNEHSCPQWVAQRWSACSTTCGAGSQRRVVTCLAHDGTGVYGCEEASKPITSKTCVVARPCFLQNRKPIRILSEEKMEFRSAAFRGTVRTVSLLPSWVSGSWSDCSTTCGAGVMRRRVRCKVILEFTETIEDLEDSECNETKPEAVQDCSRGPCIDGSHETIATSHFPSPVQVFPSTHSIFFSPTRIDDDIFAFEWRSEVPCTTPCDPSQLRWRCYHKLTNSLAPPSSCDHDETINPLCHDSSCLFSSQDVTARWDLGQFSQCSVTCGRGLRNRSVVCREMPEGTNHTVIHLASLGKRLPDIMCPAPMPSAVEACSQSPCPPQWKTGPWSKCSVQCGRGVQNRTVRCLQKLGSGKTVQVSAIYCLSTSQPIRQQACMSQKNCRHQSNNGLSKSCRQMCQINVLRRFSRCMQLRRSGRFSSVIRLRRCLAFRRRGIKSCTQRKCLSSVPKPQIHSSQKTFLQNSPQQKVRISIGQRAGVLRGTTLLIRCVVENFPSQNIRWYHNGTQLSPKTARGKRHITKLADGSLRIVQADYPDSGRYACAAGSSFARSIIRIRSPPLVTHHISVSTPLNMQTGRSKSESPDTNFDLYNNNEVLYRYKVPPVAHQLPSNQYVHPGISYARNSYDVQARSESNPVEDSYETSNSSQERFNSGAGKSNLNSIITDYLQETDARKPHDQFNKILHELVSINHEFESGRITNNERIRLKVKVFEQLNHLLDNTDVRINSRLNTARSTDSVTPLRIVRLLQEQIQNETNGRPPIIASHPTSNEPLHQDRDVTAYVGERVTITHAERVTLLCETVGNEQPEILWYRDHMPLLEDSRYLFLREGSLRILYPRFSDSGTYTCVASNSYGTDSKTTSLSVMEKPRINSITSSFTDVESNIVHVTVGSDIRAKLGAKIILRCPTEGHPDPFVVWSKDGPGLGKNTMVLADSSLQIYPATAADQGLFGCEASNPAGSDYQASSLILLDAPHMSYDVTLTTDSENVDGLPHLLLVEVPAETYQVKANTSVLMGCPITGFPQPRLSWTFNNQSLVHLGPILDYQLMKQDRVLQIPNTGSETAGNYSCFAVNEAGNFTASLTLNVLEYAYEFGAYSNCSASCGSKGMKYQSARCTRGGGIEVDDRYCTGLRKPEQEAMACNRIDCPPRFVLNEWSSCSNQCGQGMRVRTSSCVVVTHDGSSREVAREECSAEENVDEQSEVCHGQLCPRWKTKPWGLCGRKCVKRGLTEKTRQVYCVNSNGTNIHQNVCFGKVKPKSKAYCRSNQCVPVWLSGRWSSCSKSCGANGYRNRPAKCVYRGRRQQPAPNQCSSWRKPVARAACNRKKCSKASCTDQSWCSRLLQRRKCNARLRKLCCRSCSS